MTLFFTFLAATIGVGCIMVTMTLVTIPLMDRIGRRTLHLAGLFGIIVCSIMITIALNYTTINTNDIKTDDNDCKEGVIINNTSPNNMLKPKEAITNIDSKSSGVGIFLIIATLSFVIFFALGPGSIPWMAAGEMFSQGPRAAAISVCVFTNWLANLVVGLVFPQLQSHLQHFSFLPFLLVTTVLFLILLYYFIETKGKTSIEVANYYQVSRAWTTPIGIKGVTRNSGLSQDFDMELNAT